LSIEISFIRISMCAEPIRSRETEQIKLKRVTQMRVKIKDQTKLLLNILRERSVIGSEN